MGKFVTKITSLNETVKKVKKTKDHLFTKIAKNQPYKFTVAELNKAKNWARETALDIKTVNPAKMFQGNQRGGTRLVTRIDENFIGSMIFFQYDPKLKDKLPYYDRFPLVFPIEMYNDGFLGLNLHYLPPQSRARLMDALYATINNHNYDDTTRLNINYQMLKSASRFAAFKPCIKRYLFKQCESRFFHVETKQWDVVMMLPMARFVKARATTVWERSMDQIANTPTPTRKKKK